MTKKELVRIYVIKSLIEDKMTSQEIKTRGTGRKT